MNDPHVNALHYRVVVRKDVDYDNAAPLTETTEDFEFSLDGKTAVFKMKEHYSSADIAKEVVEPYLSAWDILIGLEHNPDALQLEFEHADIIDRSPDTNDGNVTILHNEFSPPPCQIRAAQAHAVGVSVCQGFSHSSRNKYPSLPKNFSASPDAETMYLRYKAYRQNRETLMSMAYMSLTILETGAGNRKKASNLYNIEFTVLDTLGKLTSIKGGPTEARKFPKDGILKPLYHKEKEWIDAVIKALILRVGQYAHDPTAEFKQLSMSDFPNLKKS